MTGIILAGGQSRRMGSEKGLVLFNGRPFISYSIDALKPLVNRLVIVSDNAAYDIYDGERIKDRFKNVGPLAGLYSGLSASHSELNLVLSCDVPLITSALLKYLAEHIDDQHDIFQLHTDGNPLPHISIYRKTCEHKCRDLILSGEKRLLALQEHHKTCTIEIPEELRDQGMNINSRDELKKLEHEYND